MNFEEMIGTTGVASDGNTLYVANNRVITRIDRVDNKTDIPHSFEFIEYLYVGPRHLCGIYAKDLAKETYGIFIMELATNLFTNIDVGYYPSIIKSKFIVTGKLLIVVLDKYYNSYMYDDLLNLEYSLESGPPLPYRTVDYIITGAVDITSANNQLNLVPEDEVLNKTFTVDNDIITTLYLANILYIVYKSGYNEYSILGYDLVQRKILKTIFGGHSTIPVYACIHLNSIYISAETNKIIYLSAFDPPADVYTSLKPTFDLFDNSHQTVQFIDETLNINTAKLKERTDSLIVDTKPVVSSHVYYYVWFIVCIFLLALMILTFFAKEKRVLNIMILLILSVALFFLLRRYI